MKNVPRKTQDDLISGMKEILRKQSLINVLKPAPTPKLSKNTCLK